MWGMDRSKSYTKGVRQDERLGGTSYKLSEEVFIPEFCSMVDNFAAAIPNLLGYIN